MYHLLHILSCLCDLLCGICIEQIRPRERVVDHAGYTAPSRQHELDHTDHTYQGYMIYLSALKDLL